MKAQQLLIKLLKKHLKSLGFITKNFTDKDWEVIACEWVAQSSDFIEETIGNDMYDNSKLRKLVKNRKALPKEELKNF